MSVLSFSVQCAGEQSPTSKSIREETTLLQADCPRQREKDKLSLAILDKRHILVEADQDSQVIYSEDDILKNLNYASPKHLNELPSAVHSVKRPLLNGECWQADEQCRNKHEQNDSFREADFLQMENCSKSGGASDANASFPKEKLCKEEQGQFGCAQMHNLSYLQCNGKGNSPEQKQEAELTETKCRSSGDMLPVKESRNKVINEDNKEGDVCSCATSSTTETQESHGEDQVQLGTLREQIDLTFQTKFEQDNMPVQEQNNERFSTSIISVQTAEKLESGVQDHNQEGESALLAADYVENHTVPLWVKWRGKWQTGFQCPRIDCPLQTLRAKPTHERKKYIAIFFPRRRTYSWADLLLICSITEFPEPLKSGNHRKWRKLVKDLTTPRRYIMQKLAVAMLNISDQLHTEAVIENARKATTWKDFAMEASSCSDYSDLGRMLLKLQTMILPTYVSDAWLENSFHLWKQKCQNAHSAESVEILTKELMDSVEWNKVDGLWSAPLQPELGPEWKTWKQEAMKWFSTSHPITDGINIRKRSRAISASIEPQISRKLSKLEVHRAESCASQMEASNCKILSQVEKVDTDSKHSICQGIAGSIPGCEPLKSQAPMDSGNVDDRIGCTKLIPSSTQKSIVTAPYQYRQCSAFIEAKGRQCGRWASDGDVYCCVHTNAGSIGKCLQDKRPPPDAPMCAGTTTHGHKCKHRARLGSAFCKKHCLQRSDGSMETHNLSTSSAKRKFGENNALIKFCSSNASNSEFGSITDGTSMQENFVPIEAGETLYERESLSKKTELYSALTAPGGASYSDFQSCIGYYGQSNSEQCLEHAMKHTLYCDKHIPKFLKRARDGKSRLVSKDVFMNLLKNCSTRQQKLYLHQACELLYVFMKRCLSRQKSTCKSDTMDWTLSEASKDVNVGEYLLKLVSCEREKIMRLWGFGSDIGKEANSLGTNSLSALKMHEKDHNPEMTVKCKICTAEFSDDQVLGLHWREIHKKEARWLFRGYGCGVCMDSYTNRKVLKSHIKERHGIQFLAHSILLRCMSCNSHFMTLEQLWQHILSFHLTELRMADHHGQNYHSMDQQDQPMVESSSKLCQNNGVSMKEDDSQGFICKTCGLKFDLLPDLSRHHQVAHTNPSSINQFRGNNYVRHNRRSHPRFKKSFGAGFRFKKQSNFGMQKRFPSSNLALSLRLQTQSQPSENLTFGRLLDSHCSEVAETLFSEMQKTKPRASNLEILSIARSACCRISLHAALEEKYEVQPENLYLKAAKLCSELNIQIGWHAEGFICPKGCNTLLTPHSLTSMKTISDANLDPSIPPAGFSKESEWEMEESHFVLDPKHFNWKARPKAIVLCEDVSFGKEPVPVACVVDEDLKNMLDINCHEVSYIQESSTLMPWKYFTYITKRLIEPSLGLDAEASQLGCACSTLICSPEKCDHVYLFDNDYENAEDIHGKSMCGRFPYDEKGRIVLEQGYLVYECNSLCNCNATCHNRVLQKGIQVKLEIFKTEKKGWAVRAGEAISCGTFVCEYIGEVLNDVDGNKKGLSSEGCSYIYDINAHGAPRGFDEGTVPYIIDATKFGNVSRFINHSCSPNLVNHLVLVESMDCQLAHIGLYACRDIARGEELAYDYCRELRPGEVGCPCYCEAPNCRGCL